MSAFCEVLIAKAGPNADKSLRVFDVVIALGKPTKVRPEVATYIVQKYGESLGAKVVSGDPEPWRRPMRPDHSWNESIRQPAINPAALPDAIPVKVLTALRSRDAVEKIGEGVADDVLRESLIWARLSGLAEVSAALVARIAAR